VQFAAGIMKELNNLLETFNGLSPTNGWADRKGKPGVRTISEGFY